MKKKIQLSVQYTDDQINFLFNKLIFSTELSKSEVDVIFNNYNAPKNEMDVELENHYINIDTDTLIEDLEEQNLHFEYFVNDKEDVANTCQYVINM